MGFYMLTFLQVLLVPGIMILSGAVMEKYYPKHPNWILGYRTGRSTKSQEAWDFANRYCGNLYWKLGLGSLLLSGAVMLLLKSAGQQEIERAGTVLTALQCILLLAPILPTERKLKEKF